MSATQTQYITFQSRDVKQRHIGATMLDMKDELLCKAFIPKDQEEVYPGKLEQMTGATRFFYDLPTYVLSPQNDTGELKIIGIRP